MSIQFVCAHCGAIVEDKDTALENGATLFCIKCAGQTVTALLTPQEYKTQCQLTFIVKALDDYVRDTIAEKLKNPDIRDIPPPAEAQGSPVSDPDGPKGICDPPEGQDGSGTTEGSLQAYFGKYPDATSCEAAFHLDLPLAVVEALRPAKE